MWAIGETRPRPHDPPRSALGFTLIEALVVVAIAALIAGIGFPNIQRAMHYWEYRFAWGEVRSALNRARANAQRTDVPVRFAVAPGNNGFLVSGEAPVALSASVRVTAVPQRPIDFYTDGSASGGAVSVVSAGHRITFTIAPDTGLVGATG